MIQISSMWRFYLICVNINEIQTSNLLDNVTMVSQTTYLFDETIEENLRIAKQDATIDEISNLINNGCFVSDEITIKVNLISFCFVNSMLNYISRLCSQYG